MYIPLSADTYDVYKGRNIFHKYYGYGRIVEYKEYSLRKGGGYGYYCKFDNEDLQDYTYTFATTSRLIQKLSNTILIETFPFEMIVQVYCDYITKTYGESKTKQEDLYNMLKKSTAGFSKHLDEIEKLSQKKTDNNAKYKETLSAAFKFFDMEAAPRDLTDTVKLMQELKALESNPDANDREEYIHTWGKVFLGLPDTLFSGGDHVNSDKLKAHFRALTPSFAPTESEANTRLKRIKIDSEIDGKLQKLLKMVWSMYKPNTPSSRALVTYKGRGSRGGSADFIIRLIFLPAVIVFLITLIGLLIVGGLIVAGFILLAIPVWAPVMLLYGIAQYLSYGGYQGGGGPRRRISMARRDKTKRGRRSGSRKKTKAKRPRRISLN